MSDSIMSKANINIDDVLKFVKPQEAGELDTAGGLDMALRPTTIVNKCSGTVLWSQCWGGIVIRYGCLSPGSTTSVSHDVRWYDYVFTFGSSTITRVMIDSGSTITLHNDDF